jgi:hypothetical protein
MSIYFYFKLLKKIYLNTFLKSKQEVLNEEEKEETMEMISVESYESSDCILSLRDLNSRLRK